jgi:hypothetical protein
LYHITDSQSKQLLGQIYRDDDGEYIGEVIAIKKIGKNSHLYTLESDGEPIKELKFPQISKLIRYRDPVTRKNVLDDPCLQPNLLGWKIHKSWDGIWYIGEVTGMFLILDNCDVFYHVEYWKDDDREDYFLDEIAQLLEVIPEE